ncbi:hypothetical protein SFUMM280S_09184 [Streptomyces fumanus]
MAVSTESIASLPALQQPDWDDPEGVEHVRKRLRSAPPLVTYEDVTELRAHLAEAAAGTLQIVQCGDCAEDWDECTPEDVARKAGLLDVLAGTMAMTAHRPVLRVGRLAGQFAKPRSRPTEIVGGVELPVYRGHMVNSPEPDAELRRPDPARLLTGYLAAGTVMELLGWPAGRGRTRPGAPVWTSHEALLLDYELPLVRRQPDGRSLLHLAPDWPWIGELEASSADVPGRRRGDPLPEPAAGPEPGRAARALLPAGPRRAGAAPDAGRAALTMTVRRPAAPAAAGAGRLT